jgi:RNA polymerase sigma-70 factor (ECF subfamily)
VIDSPLTRPSLLLRIRDARDDQAWSQFVDLYGPLIFRFVRRGGVQEHDAADLTQDVLAVVARAVNALEYDPKRGTFRGWLFTIANRKLLNFLGNGERRVQGSGDTGVLHRLHQEPAHSELDQEFWDREYEQQCFAWAGAQVRPRVEEHTWQAFWRTAVEGHDTKRVAADLGITVAAVRLAKSRVMAQIRKVIAQLQT